MDLYDYGGLKEEWPPICNRSPVVGTVWQSYETLGTYKLAIGST